MAHPLRHRFLREDPAALGLSSICNEFECKFQSKKEAAPPQGFSSVSRLEPPQERTPSSARALEIAINEEAERVALRGEFHVLERAWLEAEEIATISDTLLLPFCMGEKIRDWADGRLGGAGS